MEAKKLRKSLLQAAKIGIGSSVAIYAAGLLQLDYATSAGTITLLTIVATKWETMKLSLLRIVTFIFAVLLSWMTITAFRSEWIAYGVYIFFVVIACDLLGWKATVSVNSVIGAHFLTTKDFSIDFILNELGLVLIGITIAILLNLFHLNRSSKKEIIQSMRYTEKQLQMLLGEVAAYLSNYKMQRDVWEDVKDLEAKLHGFIADAHDYQGNTFVSHPGYYIDYFEMRLNQCIILHSLHYEMKKIRQVPKQAEVIAEYILYLMDYVVEHNAPSKQIEKLEEIFAAMKQEPMPVTRDEFENRAILYHILMELEDFLYIKKRFVENLSEEQCRLYWEQEEKEA